MQHWEIFLFFIVIAFVYASVGFGGGSSYLAILSLYALPLAEIKLTALVCNIIVVTGGTLIFIKNKQVNWRKVLPLIIASVPMAFLGARWKLEQNTFFIILGISLVTASVLLWIRMRPRRPAAHNHEQQYIQGWCYWRPYRFPFRHGGYRRRHLSVAHTAHVRLGHAKEDRGYSQLVHPGQFHFRYCGPVVTPPGRY